jgi:predicted Zn finger-like uncharacterized protein
MDIRCERCLTEYELEDDSVSEAGTSVQCTSCGYTFQVRRPPRSGPQISSSAGGSASGAAVAPAVATPPPSAEWLLETEKGQVHRFRDLSALHQWIVERKVTRTDRISRTGYGWKRLEEIVELKPFFDVVDEADRARAAVALAQHRGPQPVAPPAPAAIAVGLQSQARSARGSGPQRPPTRGVAVVRSAQRTAEVDTSVVRLRGGLSKILVTFAVAGGVAYFGITHLPPVEGQSVPPLAYPGAVKWAPEAPMVGAGSPAVAAEPVAVRSPAPPAKEAVKANDPSTAIAKPASPPPAEAAPPPAAAPKVKAAAGDRPYSELVTEARRLQENGAITRARKLYETALAMQPDGVEALAGMGYVQLDRNKFSSAISYFRRALAIGSYPAAMFGMGEAYRYAGDAGRAVDAYRRFLTLAPNDRDAPIARRQIRTLTSQARGAQGQDVPSASSILQEGAR